MTVRYDELVAEALATSLQGWDFAPLHGRVTEAPLPWSHKRLLVARLPDAASLLDLGTGGGEFLSKLAPVPPRAAATEGYPPNLPLAHHDWNLAGATAALAEAGLTVTWSREARVQTTFHDIGALVLFLRLVAWQVPDFDVNRYAHRLRVLHEEMEDGQPLTAHAHRFVLLAGPDPAGHRGRSLG